VTSVTCERAIRPYLSGVVETVMNTPAPRSRKNVGPASTWKRDLIAAMVLASSVFIGTCTFATVWAATHPELFNA
jgi:hypothetical protein